ncbi:MAG: hypothetical protein AB7F29_13890 [Candidatus Nitrosocosmicus sp.]
MTNKNNSDDIKVVPKRPAHRPLEYTKEMGDRICELVSTHPYGLRKICRLYPELPDQVTINRWRLRLQSFRIQYAQAKLDQAELLAEECMEIADDDMLDTKIDPETGYETCNTEFIARSRLRVDTRKWLASKLLPKQYGNLKEVETLTSQNDALREELRILRAELDAKNKKDY